MSVLACDRNGCENIMCSRMSVCGSYYICNECFEELVFLGHETSAKDFMSSRKRNHDYIAKEYFDKLFPLQG